MKRLDWIDYIEGEMTKAEKAKADLLLKHSISDQLVVDNLRRVRSHVELINPARESEKLINDKQYMEKLQSQIMKEVRKISRKTPLTVVSTGPVAEETLSASERGPSRPRGSYRI